MNDMATCTLTDVQGTGLNAVPQARTPDCRNDRIKAALGVRGPLPKVDEETLSRYHAYLSAQLTLPFVAHYPQPTNAREDREFRCTVVELLDPATDMGDLIDGIFCKTRKGKYEINLPLIELEVPEGNTNVQLIDDFWYWFWNWR
jgi:hypothetical protein